MLCKGVMDECELYLSPVLNLMVVISSRAAGACSPFLPVHNSPAGEEIGNGAHGTGRTIR